MKTQLVVRAVAETNEKQPTKKYDMIGCDIYV
jgi:hypothetical protein